MGAIVLVVGIVGIGAVIAAVVVFAVTRSRRNSGAGPVNPGAGTYPQNMGHAPQQPYPPMPYQGYPNPPAQPPQHPNPYPQQPPHPGQ